MKAESLSSIPEEEREIQETSSHANKIKNNKETAIEIETRDQELNNEVKQAQEVLTRVRNLEEEANNIYSERSGTVYLCNQPLSQEELSDPEIRQAVNGIKKKTERTIFATMRAVLKTFAGLGIILTLAGLYIRANPERKGRFSEKERAKIELREKGIPKDQRLSAYKPGVSELIYRSIGLPGINEDPEAFIKGFSKGLVIDRNNPILAEKVEEIIKEYDLKLRLLEKTCWKKIKEHKDTSKENAEIEKLWGEFIEKLSPFCPEGVSPHYFFYELKPAFYDAVALYLGLPQRHRTFDISDYKPPQVKEDEYFFKILNFWESILKDECPLEELLSYIIISSSDPAHPRITTPAPPVLPQDISDEERRSFVLEKCTMGIDRDGKGTFIFYQGVCDFRNLFTTSSENLPPIPLVQVGNEIWNKISQGVGKPLNIYDRFYFDESKLSVARQIQQEDQKE